MRRAWWGLVLLVGLALAGCESQPKVEPAVARFHLEARPGEPSVELLLPVSKLRINVGPKPVLTESDIATVDLAKVQLGWCLAFRFRPDAARDLYRMSVAARGRRLVAVLNGIPFGAQRIEQPLTEGGFLMFIEVPDEDLPPLADRIRRTSAGWAGRTNQ